VEHPAPIPSCSGRSATTGTGAPLRNWLPRRLAGLNIEAKGLTKQDRQLSLVGESRIMAKSTLTCGK